MHTPLSLKYRPVNFDEIIGQWHITKTLKNAISLDKLAYAYLFTGSRGVGKTSTARVFAKGLNCEKGPTENPCNSCVSCEEISKGISLDVLEIDGASNRGIDEIRNLRENIKLKPVKGIYRIYIIDEVHMLTQEAFNALLKTLEEPPQHVKFIFATTKAYKVPPTIISRCQRFDFRMIPAQVIVDKLKEIIKIESLDVEDDALFLIAKNSDGSLRDAQMMLDQLVSFTGGKVKSQDISSMFGILEQDALIHISEAIINNDAHKILEMINRLIDSGRDAMFIAASLVEHFRNLLVISVCKNHSAYVALGEEERKRLEDLSGRFSVEELFYIVYTLSNALDLIGKTPLGKIPLETALLKLSRKEKMIPISEIMKKIAHLEQSLQVTDSEIKSKSAYNIPIVEEKIPIIEEQIPNAENRPFGTLRVVPSEVEGRTPKTEPAVQHSADTLFERLKGVWPEILRGVKNKRMSAGSYLEEGHLLELRNNKIIIGFSKSNSLHKEVLDTGANKIIIAEIIRQVIEADLDIEFALSEIKETNEEEITSKDIENELLSPQPKKVDPLIKSAVDIFGGRLMKEERK